MNLKQAITEIESTSFDVRVNIASSYNTFRLAVMAEKSVDYLLNKFHLKKVQREVHERIQYIVKQKVDSNYENIWDAALSTYLLVAKEKSPDLSKEFAHLISKVKKTWWAKIISDDILAEANRKEVIEIVAVAPKKSSGSRAKYIFRMRQPFSTALKKNTKTEDIHDAYHEFSKLSGGWANYSSSEVQIVTTVENQETGFDYRDIPDAWIINNTSCGVTSHD